MALMRLVMLSITLLARSVAEMVMVNPLAILGPFLSSGEGFDPPFDFGGVRRQTSSGPIAWRASG